MIMFENDRLKKIYCYLESFLFTGQNAAENLELIREAVAGLGGIQILLREGCSCRLELTARRSKLSTNPISLFYTAA